VVSKKLQKKEWFERKIEKEWPDLGNKGDDTVGEAAAERTEEL
jgi:hypothetical protein